MMMFYCVSLAIKIGTLKYFIFFDNDNNADEDGLCIGQDQGERVFTFIFLLISANKDLIFIPIRMTRNFLSRCLWMIKVILYSWQKAPNITPASEAQILIHQTAAFMRCVIIVIKIDIQQKIAEELQIAKKKKRVQWRKHVVLAVTGNKTWLPEMICGGVSQIILVVKGGSGKCMPVLDAKKHLFRLRRET